MLDTSCFIEMHGFKWQKATRSGPQGNSEVFRRDGDGMIVIGNSLKRHLAPVRLTAEQVGEYLTDLKQADPTNVDQLREVTKRHFVQAGPHGAILADSYNADELLAAADGAHKGEFDEYTKGKAEAYPVVA
jgi:hypothetical protein